MGDIAFHKQKWEEKNKKIAEKKLKDAERARKKAARESRRKAEELKKQKEAEKKEKEDAEKEEEVQDDDEDEEPPKVELTAEEKKTWFAKPDIPDLDSHTYNISFAKYSVPKKDEGFDEIRF